MSQQQTSGNYTYQGCYNDSGNRAIPSQVQSVSSVNSCAQQAQNAGKSVFGVQYGGQCFLGTNLSQAKEYGANGGNCGTLGGSWTNQVYSTTPYTSCQYQMSSTELQCYQQRYPDLAGMSSSQLQSHWNSTGCNQQRSNQCSAPQTTSGTYTFQGCYNDTGNRAIPNYQGTFTSVDQCQQIATSKQQNIFGVQDGGQCFTGNNIQQAKEYGVNYNGTACGNLGGAWTNLVYTNNTPYPPPPPPVPVLSSINFSNETFINKDIHAFKYFIVLFIIVILCILLYYTCK